MTESTEHTETTKHDAVGDVVAEAIAYAKKAGELRSLAIRQLLEQRAQIDRDLQTLGYVSTTNGHVAHRRSSEQRDSTEPGTAKSKQSTRFRDMSLAQVGDAILREHGTLHGKKIEEIAKAGGFKSTSQNFQNYMVVAFKRAGGFKNIGGNIWQIDESVMPRR